MRLAELSSTAPAWLTWSYIDKIFGHCPMLDAAVGAHSGTAMPGAAFRCAALSLLNDTGNPTA